MWVVSLGNAFDGLTLVGPFKTFDDAIQFVDMLNEPWNIIKVEKPE